MPEKKPLAALIIAKMKKDKAPMKDEPEPAMEDEAEGPDEGLVASAEEVMSAMESGDAGAFANALKAFVEQCY